MTFFNSSVSSVRREGSEGKHCGSGRIGRSAGVKIAANDECVLVRVGSRVVSALVGVSEAVMLDIVA